MRTLGKSPTVDINIFKKDTDADFIFCLLCNLIENVNGSYSSVPHGQRPTLHEYGMAVKNGSSDILCFFSSFDFDVVRLDWNAVLKHFEDDACFAVTGACLNSEPSSDIATICKDIMSILTESEGKEVVKNLRGEQTTAFDFCMDFCFIRRDVLARYPLHPNCISSDKWARTIVQQGLHFVFDPKSAIAVSTYKSPTPPV